MATARPRLIDTPTNTPPTEPNHRLGSKAKPIFTPEDDACDPVTADKLDFTTMIIKYRTYWTSVAKKPLAEGTINSDIYKLHSCANRMGGLEANQVFVSNLLQKLKDDGISQGVINIDMMALRRLYTAMGIDGINCPIDNKWTAPDHLFYTEEEVYRIIAGTQSKSHRAIVSFLYFMGVRNVELRTVLFEHLNLRDKEVRVYGKKNKRWRTIPLDPRMMPSLNAWLELREKACESLRKEGRPVPPYLFFNIHGEQYGGTGVGTLVKRAGIAAGLSGKQLVECHPHTLRHSCANHLLHVHGWDIASVAHFLGDRIATIERYYAHTGVNECRRHMSKMA